MGAVVDCLLLGPEELAILKRQYPSCLTRNLTNSGDPFERYRVIIENESEENYYEFLFDNSIALSSDKFYSRFRSDHIFADKIKSRNPRRKNV